MAQYPFYGPVDQPNMGNPQFGMDPFAQMLMNRQMPTSPSQPAQASNAPAMRSYSDQLNDIIAPYQGIAQRMYQPYPMLGGGGGQFAQDHPLLAGALNRGLLSAAMTPGPQGPEGVGGGISRALQGVLGASQFQRQQMLQSLMLPYQMVQPRLLAEKEIAETEMWRQHGEYYNKMGDVRQQMADISQGRLDLAQDTEDKRIYGRTFKEPAERMAFLRYPPQDPQNPTPDEITKISDEYTRLKQSASGGGSDLHLNRVLQAANPKQPYESDTEYAGRLATVLERAQANIAGGKASAIQDITAPKVDERKMIDWEGNKDRLYSDIPQVPKSNLADTLRPVDPNNQIVKDQDAKLRAREAAITQRDTEFRAYTRSYAPRQGAGFQDWKKNPSAYGTLPSGDTRPATQPPQALKDPYAPDNQPR